MQISKKQHGCELCGEFLVIDPETKDLYHCYPYHFSKIYKPPVNAPIQSYQIQHLKDKRYSRVPLKVNVLFAGI